MACVPGVLSIHAARSAGPPVAQLCVTPLLGALCDWLVSAFSACENRSHFKLTHGASPPGSIRPAYYAPVSAYTFGDFLVDATARRVTRGGDVVLIPDRHIGVLLHLLAHPGVVVSKDGLIESAWSGLAVTDNSLEQAISGLRRVLGDGPDGTPYIQTVPRQGYRFTGHVTRTTARASDDSLEALLAPHRAWIEGRAALETLEADQSSARAASSRACCGPHRTRRRRMSGWPTPASCSSR